MIPNEDEFNETLLDFGFHLGHVSLFSTDYFKHLWIRDISIQKLSPRLFFVQNMYINGFRFEGRESKLH